MAKFVDVYKILEGGILFHTRLEKLKYQEGMLYLKTTPLAGRFILTGDIINLGYMSFVIPGRIVGKSNQIIVNIFYTGEGKLGDRSKPRVPVQKDQTFMVLLKIDGVFRAFVPLDISEGGFSLVVTDTSIIPEMLNKRLDFKITGREELSGVSGSARLVGIMEENTSTSKLSFEVDVDDVSSTKIRLYAINTIKRLLSDA
ncbi:hypothetical protein IAE16_03990 [Hydrogenobacter sp. T-2]|uniref:hypothetical protein n=1 Tax=Pampinifervens diazotrophicum TaxID=1632018 RepID=UPI002B256BF1|nr:hypothetical protein [Hydrogenobacter sp. T-2]WPM32847.1 hypothetical protein IAE16_03990 [Hydrogenobacter sp. T-2]